MPPLLSGGLPSLFKSPAGQMTLIGVAVCVAGIALCGWAGMSKERELTDSVKKESVREFNFSLGLLVALVAGIASACINFAITNEEPISLLAFERGAAQHWKNSATMAIFLTTGGLTNIGWCLLLNVRNRTTSDYVDAKGASLPANYVLCLLAGLIAYSEFFFYGMAESQMGKYSFTNLPIHLAFIIVFSNFWGFLFAEWKGTSGRTRADRLGPGRARDLDGVHGIRESAQHGFGAGQPRRRDRVLCRGDEAEVCARVACLAPRLIGREGEALWNSHAEHRRRPRPPRGTTCR